jgi:hypothetical protein
MKIATSQTRKTIHLERGPAAMAKRERRESMRASYRLAK